MDTLTIPVVLEKGQPKPMLWRRLAAIFKEAGSGNWELVFRKPHAKPSDPQRAWYFGQIVPLCAKECGYSKDAMHEILKARHLPKDKADRQENGVLMGELVIGGSITKLNRGEMAEYCDEIRQWANGFLGLRIPEPDPNWRYEAQVDPVGAHGEARR